MGYVLGVDAGGSKTLAVVAGRDGILLGAALAGPGSHERVGMERAMSEIRSAVLGALRAAGVESDQLETACYGLAGADWPEDFARLDEALARNVGVGRRRLIKHDAVIALRAGTRESHGVVVIFGTGACGAGRNRAGAEVVLGNLGYMYGDHSGAQAMAHEALRAVFRSGDLREGFTLLTDKVLSRFGLPDVAALKDAVHLEQIAYEAINFVAHDVLSAAAEGDAAARQILTANAQELSCQGVAVVHNLSMETDEFDLVLAGGMWKAAPPELHREFREAVTAVAPGARLVLPDLEPVVGAVLLALEDVGVSVGADIYQALHSTRHVLRNIHEMGRSHE